MEAYYSRSSPIFDRIVIERIEQDNKWGVKDHSPEKWLSILAEEVGEAAKEIVEDKPHLLRGELVQIATVCVAWLEQLDEKIDVSSKTER